MKANFKGTSPLHWEIIPGSPAILFNPITEEVMVRQAIPGTQRGVRKHTVLSAFSVNLALRLLKAGMTAGWIREVLEEPPAVVRHILRTPFVHWWEARKARVEREENGKSGVLLGASLLAVVVFFAWHASPASAAFIGGCDEDGQEYVCLAKAPASISAGRIQGLSEARSEKGNAWASGFEGGKEWQ